MSSSSPDVASSNTCTHAQPRFVLDLSPRRLRTAPGPLVRRAALGLLRVAGRLLSYRDDVSEPVLRSLQLLPRLHPNVAWELAEPIAQQVPLSCLPLQSLQLGTLGHWCISDAGRNDLAGAERTRPAFTISLGRRDPPI